MKFVAKLTKKQSALYVANPSLCPFCASSSLGKDDIVDDVDEASSSVCCHTCARQWTEIWALTTIEPEEIICDVCSEFIEDGQDVQTTEEGMFVHISCLQQG